MSYRKRNYLFLKVFRFVLKTNHLIKVSLCFLLKITFDETK